MTFCFTNQCRQHSRTCTYKGVPNSTGKHQESDQFHISQLLAGLHISSPRGGGAKSPREAAFPLNLQCRSLTSPRWTRLWGKRYGTRKRRNSFACSSWCWVLAGLIICEYDYPGRRAMPRMWGDVRLMYAWRWVFQSCIISALLLGRCKIVWRPSRTHFSGTPQQW